PLDVEARVKDGGASGRFTAHEPGLPIEASFAVSKAGVVDVDAIAQTADFGRTTREPLTKLRGRGPVRASLHVEKGVLHGTGEARLSSFAAGDVHAASAALKGTFVVPLDAPEKATGAAHVTGDGVGVRALELGKVSLDARGG